MMVRTMDSQKSPVQTPKILNLYNKPGGSASSKKNSVVLTTTVLNSPANGSSQDLDFDSSEITVIFEDEIETLYIGPVAISEEEQQKKRLEEAKAAAAASTATAGSRPGPKNKQLSPVESTSNGSDSGIDAAAAVIYNSTIKRKRGRSGGATSNTNNNNNNINNNNKKKNKTTSPVLINTRNTSPAPSPASSPLQQQQPPPPQEQSAAMSPPKPSYECDLCSEMFMREDTIIDHYQSYHRVDPNKRTIKPILNIPVETDPLQTSTTVADAGTPSKLPESTSTSFQQHSPADRANKQTPQGAASPSAPFRCDDCNLTFKNKIWHSRHVNKVHKEVEIVVVKPSARATVTSEVGSGGASSTKKRDPTYEPPATKRMPRSSGAAATAAASLSPTQKASPKETLQRTVVVQRAVVKSERKQSPKRESFVASTSVPQKPQGRGRKRKGEGDSTVVKIEMPVMQEGSPDNDEDEQEEQEEKQDLDLEGQANVIYVKMVPSTEPTHTETGDEVLYEIMQIPNSDGERAVSPLVFKTESPGRKGRLSNEEKKHCCTLCDARFSKKCSVEPHMIRVHQKVRDKPCSFCDRMFTMTGDLTRHMRIHTGEKPYHCEYPQCSFRFITKGDLHKHERRHWRKVNPLAKALQCDQCSAAFERTYDLKRHKTTHSKQQMPGGVVSSAVIRCELCPKTFVRKEEYKAHSLRHLGLKSFKCHVCGKPFSDQSNCAKHVKMHGAITHSTGNRDPLICEYCGDHCTNNTAISRHLIRCPLRFNGQVPNTVPSYDYFDDWK